MEIEKHKLVNQEAQATSEAVLLHPLVLLSVRSTLNRWKQVVEKTSQEVLRTTQRKASQTI